MVFHSHTSENNITHFFQSIYIQFYINLDINFHYKSRNLGHYLFQFLNLGQKRRIVKITLIRNRYK